MEAKAKTGRGKALAEEPRATLSAVREEMLRMYQTKA